jgi:hypothetical protein
MRSLTRAYFDQLIAEGLYTSDQVAALEDPTAEWAVFAGIWVGDREIKRTEYRDLFASILSDTSSNWVSLVAPGGFEPPISALRGLRPSPLDDGATLLVGGIGVEPMTSRV